MASAKVHDSQVFDTLLVKYNSSADVWADPAYRSADSEVELREARFCSHIHRKDTCGRPLNAGEQEVNRKRSTVRARAEHVIAQQANQLVRTIGLERAAVKIGKMNLVYNMRRLAWFTG